MRPTCHGGRHPEPNKRELVIVQAPQRARAAPQGARLKIVKNRARNYQVKCQQVGRNDGQRRIASEMYRQGFPRRNDRFRTVYLVLALIVNGPVEKRSQIKN